MRSVLVVDDNLDNRELVSTLLTHRGHRPLVAADGAEALEIVRRERPELVISDILMPTMDGYELVREIRQDPALAKTKVVFYTAHYHQREARSLADSCGVACVLAKPCEPEEMMLVIDRLLSDGDQPMQRPVEKKFDREHLKLMTDVLAEKADQLESANARLKALTELNLRLSSERDMHVLLRSVCRGARELIGAKYAVLVVREKSQGSSVFTITSGIASPGLLAVPVLEASPLAPVLDEGKTLRLEHLGGDPRKAGLPAGYPPAHAMVAAPVASLANIYGWVCLVNKVGARCFDEDDERLLKIVAAQFGRVYENGSLYQQVKLHAEQLQREIGERMRAAELLRESEERFREVAETIQDAFYVTTPDTNRMIYLSPAYERIWGRSRRETFENPRAWVEAVHPDDRVRVLAYLQDIGGSTVPTDVEYRIVRPDGAQRWILARTFPILGDDGRPTRNVGVATDITDRKNTEAKVEHLNRVYAVLSGINALIVRVDNRDGLLRDACRLAVGHGRFRLAWAGLLDQSSQSVRTIGCAGDDMDFMSGLEVPLAYANAAPTLLPLAMQSGRPAVCNDIESTTDGVGFREQMLARGCRSAAALPLVISGRSVGCLVLVAEERNFFDDDEMKLLLELAGDIAFALDHLDKAEKLDYLAYYDSLTGLANRTFFGERLSQHVAAAARSGRKFALVHADIERLDLINSTYGRHVGDRVLKELADRFGAIVGDKREVARLVSDHFATVIADVREEADVARKLEEWWRNSLGKPIALGTEEIKVNIRAGIAMYPQDGADAEALLTSAAAALRKAKSGTERFTFFTQELSRRIAESAALEQRLRKALENDEFVLYYQPKVDLEERRILGVEALIRWISPELGLVPPGKFIPLMEETGMINDAGAWALRQATLDRSRWLEKHLNAPPIAVNVSTVQLQRQDFVRTVTNIMRLGGAPGGIDIEVTESLIMHDVAGTIEKLKAIRALGVGIAIDDFGTGHSSLGYLAKLPVDTLKIDRSFVAAMLEDPGAMTLVSTIISLAHALKLKVVAEGVESEEQAKILRLLRCDQMQGYLVSKPLPFDEMTARLARVRT